MVLRFFIVPHIFNSSILNGWNENESEIWNNADAPVVVKPHKLYKYLLFLEFPRIHHNLEVNFD